MYETFYNLSESPFRLTPDPRFYFSSATHKRALTHLRFGFHQREGFVVITGKPGTGKTELMLHLLEGLPKERISYGKIVTSNLDANQTLQQVAAAFQIPAEGVKKGILLKKLEDFFLQQVRENKRLILIVDEAHKLSLNSLNELQMLTNFQLNGKAALQCFLSGHDTLKIKLHDPDLLHLKQRVITSTFLTPLEKQETGLYVEHRLQCAGWQGDPKFNQTAYSLIFDVTEGIPRQINALCNRILLRAYAEQKHYIDESMVSRAIDDVQSEPLATNPRVQPTETQITPTAKKVGASEGFQAAFERSMQQTSVFKPAYQSHDEDETLPLTSVQDFHSPNHRGDTNSRAGVPSYGASAAPGPVTAAASASQHRGHTETSNAVSPHQRRPVGDNQEDTLDDARRFSDALTNFHQQTASQASVKANKLLEPEPARTGHHLPRSATQRNDALASLHFAHSLNNKPRKTWVAPVAYGSVAFLLIALGVSVWAYKFSADVLGVIEAKNPHDNRFVAAIKGLLMRDHADTGDSAAESADQTIIAEKSTVSATNELAAAHEIAADQINVQEKPQDLAAADAGIRTDDRNPAMASITTDVSAVNATTTSARNSADISAAQSAGGQEVKGSDIVDEKWDSGALGGNYLVQQGKPSAQQQSPSESNSSVIASKEIAFNGTNNSSNNSSNNASKQNQATQTNATADSESRQTLIAQLEKMIEKKNAQSTKNSLSANPTSDSRAGEERYSGKADQNAASEPSVNQSGSSNGISRGNSQAANSIQNKQHTAGTQGQKNKVSLGSGAKSNHANTNHVIKKDRQSAIEAEHNNKEIAQLKPVKQQTLANTKSNASLNKGKTASETSPSHRVRRKPKVDSPAAHMAQAGKETKTTPVGGGHKSQDNSPNVSENVAMINNETTTAGAQANDSSVNIEKVKLNHLLSRLTQAYEKGNLQELLSVLSKDVRSNDGSTRSDLKNGYRKLFNITDMRKMTISSVTWSQRENFIHGKGEFQLHVREKGADTISSYGGVISLDVEKGAGGIVITRLNYDYKN